MKKFVKILTGVGVALIAFLAWYTCPVDVTSASAQTSSQGSGGMTPRYGTVRVFGNYSGSGVAVTNLHSSATNLNVQLDTRFQSAVGLQIEGMMSAAGPSTMTLAYAPSIDDGISGGPGQQFATTLQTIALSFGAGTNAVVTNIVTYGAAKIQLYYITNASGTVDCTNLVVKYGAQQLTGAH